jgi:beta-galactoside alpha-2,6-sialyltransferase (sialyltransferase 1)
MLDHCRWVDIYEYIPSLRTTPRCYYFDPMEELGCTFGGWHPLATEKLMVLAMNSATDEEVYLNGKVRLKGFEQLNCTSRVDVKH